MFKIFIIKFKKPRNIVFQTVFKAVNDMAGPDGLVPTFFVFGVYLRVIIDSLLSPLSQQYAKIIQKAMIKLRKIIAKCKVAETFRIRNNPDTVEAQLLTIGSEIKIYREYNG